LWKLDLRFHRFFNLSSGEFHSVSIFGDAIKIAACNILLGDFPRMKVFLAVFSER